MGWKSTIDITRQEAIQAIMSCVDTTPYDNMSNEQLIDVMNSLNMGDDTTRPFFWL